MLHFQYYWLTFLKGELGIMHSNEKSYLQHACVLIILNENLPIVFYIKRRSSIIPQTSATYFFVRKPVDISHQLFLSWYVQYWNWLTSWNEPEYIKYVNLEFQSSLCQKEHLSRSWNNYEP